MRALLLVALAACGGATTAPTPAPVVEAGAVVEECRPVGDCAAASRAEDCAALGLPSGYAVASSCGFPSWSSTSCEARGPFACNVASGLVCCEVPQ